MRRWAIVAAIFVILGLVIPLEASAATAPAAPSQLTMARTAGGPTLGPGSWTNIRSVTLRFQVQAGSSPVTPQVEIEPSGTAFTNQPNFSGAATSTSGLASVTATGLQSGKTYHWQARITEDNGTSSSWVPFGATPNADDLGVDTTVPTRPTISSPNDPNQNRWYHTRTPIVRWSSRDPISGIAGYRYVLERHAHVINTGPTISSAGARIANLGSGSWVFAIRAKNNAGTWSGTSTFRLLIDRHPPVLTYMSPAKFHFNPYEGKAAIKFRVNKVAAVTFQLFRVGAKSPTAIFKFHAQPNRVIAFTWSGRGPKGNPLPAGYYFFSTTLYDTAGNVAHLNVGGIYFHPAKPLPVVDGVKLYPDGGKRILVSLNEQKLYAYDGTHLVLSTLVTTGNPLLPTPLGSYRVLARYSPFQFVSPWPMGSPFYYAPSWVSYALLFQSQGYFLHDAPWRSVFGPGSNGYGTPGTNYGGSHGCVNIPLSAMTFLWNWTPTGTPVDIIP